MVLMSDTIDAIREKYPVYADVSDDELIKAIGTKYPVYLQSDPKFQSDFERVTQPKTTATGAFARAAGSSVVPAAGAWGGAETGALVGAAIPGLGETGIGELGGAFVGGIIGSLLADKTQNAVVKSVAPETYKQLQQYHQEDASQHPIATAAGGLIGSLPTFKIQNPIQTARGAAALYKIAKGQAVSEGEKLLAKHLAMQAGMGTAGGIVQPLVQGQKPTIGEVSQGLAQALLFGAPRIGSKTPLETPKPPIRTPDTALQSKRPISQPEAIAKPPVEAPKGFPLDVQQQKALEAAKPPAPETQKNQGKPPETATNPPGTKKTVPLISKDEEQKIKARFAKTPTPALQANMEAYRQRAAAAMKAGKPFEVSKLGLHSQWAREELQRRGVAVEPQKLPGPGTGEGPGTPKLGQGPDIGEGGGNPDITGVRQETRVKMAKAGIKTETQRTPGVTLEQTLQEGRNILAQNPNAGEEAVKVWENTGRSSYEDFAALRAKIDQLRSAGRKLESTLGTDSPEFQQYLDNIYRLDKAAKDIQGQLWHRLGVAQQGELDVDTGSVLGLESDYMDKTKGRKFTPSQRKQAGKKAKDSEQANQADQKATETVHTKVEQKAKGAESLTKEQAREELSKLPKPKGDFSDEQAKILWGRVHQIIKNGVVKPDDVISQVANDLGLKNAEVRRALSKDQTVRKLLEDAYLKRYRARQVKNAAKQWVEAQTVPPLLRNVIAMPRVLRALAVFGHWSTWIGTHAGQVLYDPPRWVSAAKAWKTMVAAGRPGEGGEILWEQKAADLVRDKNWATARRAGLNNDPYQRQGSEYYDTPLVQGVSSKFSTGGRGVIGLLQLRQTFFNDMWDKLPPSGKTREAAEYIAELANTATGTTRSQWGQGNIGRALLFAPRLVAARLKWEFTEPAKALLIKTFKHGTATPAEQMYANEVLKRRAIFLATMFAGLGLNQAFLDATDSKQKINWSNPHRSDWLAFKGFGMEVRPFSAGMLILRSVSSIYDDIFRTARTGRHLPVEPFKSAVGDAGQFFREELNPTASDVTTYATQADAFGIPLPDEKWRTELGNPPPKLTREQIMRGEQPYTWARIASEQLSPIPFEASIREALESQGMRPDMAAHWTRIILGSGAMAATGVRVQEDTEAQSK
jgi:hypothetical protein